MFLNLRELLVENTGVLETNANLFLHQTRDTKTVYRGPTAPITCVAIGGPKLDTVFGGCWDKDIWSWNGSTRSVTKRYKGHSDFVKCVLVTSLQGEDILISGGADAKIMVWSVEKGTRIHVLRDKSETMMAVQCLTLDPRVQGSDILRLFSSSSDPHIRQWTISLNSAEQIYGITAPESGQGPGETILEHETSIYSLTFDEDHGGSEDHLEIANLWTASADGTAKCLSSLCNWTVEETFGHGDYVRAVAITPDWVITAGRSEDIKIWNRGTGDLFHVYEGHYEEVTGLVTMAGNEKIVSVSIDGTLRTWSLLKGDIERIKKEEEDRENGLMEDEVPSVKKTLLTEEEERELAELMDDSD